MRLFIFLACIMLATNVFAKDVPKPSGHVTDKAGMLSSKEEKSIEKFLTSYEKAASIEIAVLTVESLDGEVLEDFSIKVAQKWGVGKKGKDNGVLLLIAKKERKMRLEVGYGLEGDLTDAMAGRIIDGEIKSKFKEKEYYIGINSGVIMITNVLEGEFTKEDLSKERKTSSFKTFAIIAAGIAAVVGALNWILGGITGGALGGIIAGMFFGSGMIIVGVLIGIVVGVIGGLIILSSGEGGGGYSSGDSYGGGSSSSISFGGGSFGGGGASGGW